MSGNRLPSWRQTPAKQAIVEFVAVVTDPGSAEYVPEPGRIAVFDNDGTLWTEQPMYAQLAFALGGRPSWVIPPAWKSSTRAACPRWSS